MKLVVGDEIMSSFDINKFIGQLRKKNFWKNLLLFICGVALSAFALNLFFKRYNIVAGGANGLSILLDYLMSFDISIILLILNLACLIIGLIFFGWEYAAKMLMVTFLLPLFVRLTLYITDLIDLEDTSMFLLMVIGGGLSGYANGLIRNSGYSPGGFYSLYDVMSKYLHISIGTSNAIINTIIICLGGFYFGLENAIYAIISLLVAAYIVDRVTIGISDNKVFYIITEKPLEVSDYVNEKLNYDLTVVNARGGYTNKRKKMLMCVVPTIEYVKLKEIVKEIDKKAFFLIVDTYESSVRKKCKNM